jgi:hypothetical protein
LTFLLRGSNERDRMVAGYSLAAVKESLGGGAGWGGGCVVQDRAGGAGVPRVRRRVVNLPVAVHDGDLLIIDQDTGQAFPIGQASDHTLAAAVEKIAEFDRDLFTAKRAVAAELRPVTVLGSRWRAGMSLRSLSRSLGRSGRSPTP